ncbi:nitroreductase family protein [Mycena galericulata]|nr:nitroreductase family protein [Mycena galericulata]
MSDAYIVSIATRRTHRAITANSSITDEKLEAIIKACMLHSPTPFNMQSSRAVIVTGKANTKLWDLIRESTLKGLGERKNAKEVQLAAFGGGYGSVLFFEDQAVLAEFSEKMPAYAKWFPVWSTNAAGIVQAAVWTSLTLEGLGASLQHNGAYSDELVDNIHKAFSLPSTWTSTAIMPFGVPAASPVEKSFNPIEDRVKIIRE